MAVCSRLFETASLMKFRPGPKSIKFTHSSIVLYVTDPTEFPTSEKRKIIQTFLAQTISHVKVKQMIVLLPD